MDIEPSLHSPGLINPERGNGVQQMFLQRKKNQKQDSISLTGFHCHVPVNMEDSPLLFLQLLWP